MATLINALVPGGWPIFILISARVIGVMLVAPMWSMPMLPANVRVALAVAISIALQQGVPTLPVDAHVAVLPAGLAIELLLGVAIGLAAALFLHGVAIAGEVVSVQMGLSIAGALAPSTGVSGPGLGAPQGLMALAVYFVMGGHLLLLESLGASFQVLPPGGSALVTSGLAGFVDVAGSTFVTAVQIAAPVMVAMMLTNVVLAILNRAVPQINTLMVAFPITIGLGLIVFAASLPFVMRAMEQWVVGVPDVVQRAFDGFLVR